MLPYVKYTTPAIRALDVYTYTLPHFVQYKLPIGMWHNVHR
jgi:hypothetical protein